MARVLLAAEADRIQELIFRSSRLREVTGGSHALETFWIEAEKLARAHGAESVPVQAGGTLRALFRSDDGAKHAAAFERDLRDLYALRTGGRLSVTCVTEGDNAPAGPAAADALLDRRASHALGAAKAAGDPPAASAHFPYLQPCASCGREPASETRTYADESTEDLCRVCYKRADLRDEFQGEFLADLPAAPGGREASRLAAALEEADSLPGDSEEVGRMDGRGRVAYLLADGNGFGALFARTTESGGFDALQKLSATVGRAGRTALASATADLLAAVPVKDLPSYEKILRGPDGRREGFPRRRVPVLPLITGGDDVFALLPAPWAFWFAERFAAAFVGVMDSGDYPGTSVSCALVFAKATFPYRLAHRVGETALGEAKRVAREHDGVSVLRAAELRDTVSHGVPPLPGELGVFSLTKDAAAPVAVSRLMDARRTVSDLPRKRRHQLEAIFAAEDLGQPAWQQRLEHAIGRAELRDAGAPGAAAALRGLGSDGEGWVGAPVLERPKRKVATGAVDLLHLWDYLRTPGEAQDEG